MKLLRDTLLPDSLQLSPEGFRLAVRLPWYRSLPLSCVEELAVVVDGHPIHATDLSLELDGHTYQLHELTDRTAEVWFVQDRAVITGGLIDHQLTAGQPVEVSVTLAVRIPYILTGPDSALVNHVTDTKTLTAAGQDQT